MRTRDYPILGIHDYPILGNRDYPILGAHDYAILGLCDYPIVGNRDHPVMGNRDYHWKYAYIQRWEYASEFSSTVLTRALSLSLSPTLLARVIPPREARQALIEETADLFTIGLDRRTKHQGTLYRDLISKTLHI